MSHQWAILYPLGTTAILVGLVYGATWIARAWNYWFPKDACNRRHR